MLKDVSYRVDFNIKHLMVVPETDKRFKKRRFTTLKENG